MNRVVSVRQRVVILATGFAFAGLSLAGCATTPPELSSTVSADMQNAVVSIAESAATGDATGALQHLDALQQQLDAALADGSVSEARASAIQSALDVVRADLQSPAPIVEPSTEPTADPGTTDDDDDDSSNGNEGNGNGNGNSGNDKGGKDDGSD